MAGNPKTLNSLCNLQNFVLCVTTKTCSYPFFHPRNKSYQKVRSLTLCRQVGAMALIGANVVVRASALQSANLGFISPSRVIPKDFKNWYSQLSCLALSKKGIMWRTSWQACLLCSWPRHLTGCLHLHVAEQVVGPVYPSWWPRLIEDLQTEHELLRSVCASRCIMLSTIAQTTTKFNTV